MKSNITGHAQITVNASVDKVWDALTNPQIIKQYFFGTNTKTDWKPGSPITFEGEYQGKQYKDKGNILDVEKNKLLRYTYWSSMSGIEDKPENYVIVSFKLSVQDGDVKVEVTQENIPDEKSKTHSEENWNKVLEGLKKIVEGKNS